MHAITSGTRPLLSYSATRDDRSCVNRINRKRQSYLLPDLRARRQLHYRRDC